MIRFAYAFTEALASTGLWGESVDGGPGTATRISEISLPALDPCVALGLARREHFACKYALEVSAKS